MTDAAIELDQEALLEDLRESGPEAVQQALE